MYFLAQYQNHSFSQSYRAVCASRFDGWWPAQLRSQNTEERNRARQNRLQWDYAMILVDRSSATGYYKKWEVDWQGRYPVATATGYPSAMLRGEIIQKADGEIFVSHFPNVVGLRHDHPGLMQGSSGGAWVVNFNQQEDTQYNLVVSVTSFIIKQQSGFLSGHIRHLHSIVYSTMSRRDAPVDQLKARARKPHATTPSRVQAQELDSCHRKRS
jgi:hypothetical protein